MPIPTTTSVKLDHETASRLQRLASARRHSPDWVMREALAQYLEREERREQLRQDAFAAWQDYQTTGLHLTFEEVDAYLTAMEAGEPADLPKCHT